VQERRFKPLDKRERRWTLGTILSVQATARRFLRYVDDSQRHVPTLGEYLETWLDLCQTRGLRAATIASYRATLRLHVSERLLATRIDRVTSQALNDLYGYLLRSGRKHGEGGLSARTVRYVYTLLRRAYADAVRLGIVEINPVDSTDPPSVRSARARPRAPWTPEELKRFLSAARCDPLYAAYHLAAATGMRRGEILGLRWSDLDFEARQLRVMQTVVEAGHVLMIGEPKSDRSRRVIALDQHTVAVLREYRGRAASQRTDRLEDFSALVFAHTDGSPIHPACFSYAFSRRVRAVGARCVRFHDLRHGHATMALRAGVHPKVVCERLGHSSVAITLDVYSHAIPSMQREAADVVASLWA
jgi:integrase